MRTATICPALAGSTPRRGLLATLALAVASAAIAMVPATAAADVEWTAEIDQAPTRLPIGDSAGPGRGLLFILPANEGGTEAPEVPTVSFELPAGVTLDASLASESSNWNCTGSSTVTCVHAFSFINVPPYAHPGVGLPNPIRIVVDVAEEAAAGLHPVPMTIEGGGDQTTLALEIEVGTPPGVFGPRAGSFLAQPRDELGAEYTQAGGHPFVYTTTFDLNTEFIEPASGVGFVGAMRSVESLKDVVVDLPPGFIGDPSAAAKCADLGKVYRLQCPHASQVGVASISPPLQTNGMLREYGVYNVVPEHGAPAQFAFKSPLGLVLLTPVLRNDGEMGLSVRTRDVTQVDVVMAATVTMWGVPSDPVFDAQRCPRPNFIAGACVGNNEAGSDSPDYVDLYSPHSSNLPRRPFLSLPTRCDEDLVTALHLASWESPASFQPDGDPNLSDDNWASAESVSPAVEGCDALDFTPSLTARPTTSVGDSPTGLQVDLHLPQNPDPDGLATGHLRKATVTLPEGLVVNPSSANGLGACSPADIHLGDRLPDSCPDAAKVGTVEVDTPLLDNPLRGGVYVATPHDNPFDSLMALYITVDDPQTGIVVKLAGHVIPNPKTGQLTAVFDDNPQVPFEDFKLDFFGGAAASLKTPATCGTYSTTSELTPWSAPQSGPPAAPSDTWAISTAPGGGACAGSEAQLPNAPSFEAGSTSPLAGQYSPFVLNLRRDDGTQQFSSLTVKPPAGLVAKLAGTPPCSEAALAQAAAKSGRAEQASPSCPSASEVGSVHAAAGAGPAPYNAPGKAYLAGPYKGAPLSLAIITPAVAGPFDLGTIVVRTALHLDPKSAQITAVSDPIPTILQGIPLDVRSVQVRLDKPSFTLNPTSCDPTQVTGSLLTTTGASAALNNRFQLAECDRLGFKPKLALFLKGGTKRSEFPALTAILKPRAGDANIKSISVAMPPSEFLAQSHIRTVCTRVQFAADRCPKASIYGTATVSTPLLDYKLSGPVYLRSSDNPLPDLVPDLRGPAHQPIRLESSGRTDSVNRGIRNTFDFVPDAPFTKLVLQLQGGKKGLLENSRDICAEPYRARVSFGAHNGATYSAKPLLRARCGKGRRGGKGKGAGGERGGRG